ncbi:MAG: phosphohydrolase [Chloroflexi bacterium]|nr:phosphohydrolase [Chloroflexota bacterium]
MKTTRAGDWFATFSGVKFYPLDPRPEDINVTDIARGLAFQCRFNGHVEEFYSVAQHSILVASILPDDLKLWGLMHDAAEAYIGDMVRPLKLHQPTFRAVEAKIMAVICERLGLPIEEPPEVKSADIRLLVTERRDILHPTPTHMEWSTRAEPIPEIIVPMDPHTAYAEWLKMFELLEQRVSD